MELIGMLVFLVFGLSTVIIFLNFGWQNLRTKQYRAVGFR